MISVCIWGLPELDENVLTSLAETIHQALLPITRNYTNVTIRETFCVFCQKDLRRQGSGETILIEIKGCHPDLAHANRNAFKKVIDTVKALVTNCINVECRVEPRGNEILVVST